MTRVKPRKARTGTCWKCNTEQAIARGKLVEHVFRNLTQRCDGTGSVPREVREKSRNRSRAKRRATVDAVRGDASVLLDAILHKRTDLDLDDEIDRARLLELAFVGYRLDHAKARVQGGMLWVSAKKHHEIFCRFCGVLIAKIGFGGWTPMSQENRDKVVGRHILICALQYLAGIRTPPNPGTKMYPQLGPRPTPPKKSHNLALELSHAGDAGLDTEPKALSDESTRDHDLPLPYLIQCPACGAGVGTACVDYESKATSKGRGITVADMIVWSEALQLECPHEARQIAAGLSKA